MKKNKWLLLLIAVVLIAVSGVGTAMAYFTTYVTAKGGYVIKLEDESEIIEDVISWTKHVTILNKEGSSPVFVRVKAFAIDPLMLEFRGDNWQKGETDQFGYTYYYYTLPVEGGKQTEPALQIHIGPAPEGSKLHILSDPDEAKPGDSFNVVVVYESVPAVYTAHGVPDMEASWKNSDQITVITEGTGDAA